jgi:hypothetical protein
MKRYTQGLCEDGAAILCDGEMITVDQIISTLNHAEDLVELLVETHNKLADMTDFAKKQQGKHLGDHQGDVYHAMQALASQQGLRHEHTKKVQLALANYREATK